LISVDALRFSNVRLLLTAKLTLITKSECSADEANAATDEEAEKFLEASLDEEKKMETGAPEDADNLVCAVDLILFFVCFFYFE